MPDHTLRDCRVQLDQRICLARSACDAQLDSMHRGGVRYIYLQPAIKVSLVPCTKVGKTRGQTPKRLCLLAGPFNEKCN